MESITRLVEFLEKHPESNTFLIFILGLIVAWASGAFNATRGFADKLDNRLRLRITPASARYCIVRSSTHESSLANLFAIWLSVELGNPSDRISTVVAFELRYRTQRSIWKGRWSPALRPLTFPSIPQQYFAGNLKLLPVFFSTFPEMKKLLGGEIARDGKVPPNDFQNGYLLFVEECFGDLLPSENGSKIYIQISCFDIKNKRRKSTAWAKSISVDSANEFIPGLSEYAQTEQAKSFLHRWESTINCSTDEGRSFLAELSDDSQEIDSNQKQAPRETNN